MHGNCCLHQPYAYQVQYYDNTQPKYTPFELTDNFLPKFKLLNNVVPSIDATCNLSLPNIFLDGIVEKLCLYAITRTELSQTIMVEENIKKNPRYMHPSKFRDITRQDILYFCVCYYYTEYCRLTAKQDY